jgi:uncharacterized protein YeaC (DUF1315 family)
MVEIRIHQVIAFKKRKGLRCQHCQVVVEGAHCTVKKKRKKKRQYVVYERRNRIVRNACVIE